MRLCTNRGPGIHTNYLYCLLAILSVFCRLDNTSAPREQRTARQFRIPTELLSSLERVGGKIFPQSSERSAFARTSDWMASRQATSPSQCIPLVLYSEGTSTVAGGRGRGNHAYNQAQAGNCSGYRLANSPAGSWRCLLSQRQGNLLKAKWQQIVSRIFREFPIQVRCVS